MFDHILSLLFPEHCRGCHKSGTALCPACLAAIPPSFPILEALPCFAFFDYGNSIVQTAIWELKYHRKSPAAKILALQGAPSMHEYIASLVQSPAPMPIVLVPVPQTSSKTADRGFNQSALIARWLQSQLPEAAIRPLLIKTRTTAAQARTHDRQERARNLNHSMKASRHIAGKLDRQALYIIIDDVITTGSTVNEAGRALRAAGAKHICAVALAHGYAQRW
jgi:ComF family protein